MPFPHLISRVPGASLDFCRLTTPALLEVCIRIPVSLTQTSAGNPSPPLELSSDTPSCQTSAGHHIHIPVTPRVFLNFLNVCCVCLVTQLCPTLCNPMDYSLPVSSVHEDSPGKNTRVGCPPPGDLHNKGWNPGLLHCRQILHHMSHQGSP